ncbi:non-specific lipid transfer protein GPI-anchored 14-like isoform X2 [Pyrus x bretschneideri]|uniref:non-specific lipid transfer protein GPI-anchored 14-like isoform X2 n=1 Tax=Pyrus x bretschneideri TaxID=225117 RepID=UPI00202E48C2|nr:non-specific lipid transfer protein GPI-anchored 14-like isoform X2 [Pyrus x bretschneideri]
MALGFGYLVLVLLVMISSYTASFATADSAKDREECTQQLVGMATCLPYVGGQAKAPTPDCCSGLKQVLNNNKKCLCVIIKDRNDPELGLQMNVTLALGLPSVCKAPANVSKCPELLHLDPKSPEAQVFYQLEGNSTKTASSLAPSPSGHSISSEAKSDRTDEFWSDSNWRMFMILSK